MRFFHDGAAIVRDTIPPLPSRSLSASIVGDRIVVSATNGYVLASLHCHEIQRQDGTFFTEKGAAKAYLDEVFASYSAIPGHTHSIVQVVGLQGALDGKAATSHTHIIGDVTGLQAALDSKQPIGNYASATHTHVIADVSGLQSALDGKAAASHNHTIAQVTGLQAALDGKQPAGSYAPLSHVTDTNNPHGVTKAQLGLGNADNTSDANKPVSTATQTALNAKLAATFTPSTPTRVIGTAFQPSAAKAVLCIYSIKTQVTNPLLIGTSTATVQLLSDATATPMTERARAEATSGVGITVTIALTTSNTATVAYLAPAGHYVLLKSTVTGQGATSIVAQTEIALG